MIEDVDIASGKSIGELGHEAFWFVAHTIIAVLVLAVITGVLVVLYPNAEDAATPKLIGLALAFFVPLIVGFIIAKAQQNDIARYVWISGLLMFSVACVWVIDLPTGPGLCEQCGNGHLLEKLWRTFFDFNNGSGLMGGDGLLIGTMVPLSMFGYAIGAKFGLDS